MFGDYEGTSPDICVPHFSTEDSILRLADLEGVESPHVKRSLPPPATPTDDFWNMMS
jgi:hypothetical protein